MINRDHLTSNEFNVANIELSKGSHLIEASAGTGKTYSIAMLVMRFVAEQGVAIESLLVVTFTHVATADLKKRVRLRLIEGRQALSGQIQGIDNNVVEWAKNLQQDKAQAQLRLEQALLNIDQAAIFTIHGFCQRALKEFALESRQLFDSELTSDVSQLRLQITEDYWREQVYLQPLWAVSILTQKLATPGLLLQSINGISMREVVYPAAENLEVILQLIEEHLQVAKVALPRIFQRLQKTEAQGFFKGKYLETLNDHYQILNHWLQHYDCLFPVAALIAFTSTGVKAGLNGHQFKAKNGVSAEQRKQAYLQALDLNTECFTVLQLAIAKASLMFRRNLVDCLHSSQEIKLQQRNQLSFDNLIFRLSEALQEQDNGSLKSGLQQRYQVALIDEFQDTDQAQWHIFSSLFTDSKHSLYLIGDPKQAIYKFRGADVFSYFAASESAQYHYSLVRNWRSHPDLVNAVNQLFVNRQQPFWLPQLQFQSSRKGQAASAGKLLYANQATATMALWQLAKSEDNESGFWGVTKAVDEIRIAVVNEIIQLLVQPQGASISRDNVKVVLQPKDIAILVRTNKHARDYQMELDNAGVPSVLNSTESVFDSIEAKDLYRLLQAIAQPSNLMLLKQALTLSWFNLDGQALYSIINDKQLLDAWLTRFQSYYELWQRQGLMAMMHQVLAIEQVEIHLANSPIAERKITNIQHLIELLQQAIVEAHLGPQKALEWLQRMITEQSSLNDDKQLRLESDEQAVKIITLHRCKGLEYPVVFCPMLWHRSTRLSREKQQVRCHENGEMITDMGSDKFQQRQEQALSEELSEDLRLLYVAVTRAKYRCYLVWADVRSKNLANNSALAYLLFSNQVDVWQRSLAEFDFTQQRQRLQTLVSTYPDSFSYHCLATKQKINQFYPNPNEDLALSVRQFQGNLSATWSMTSYTALAALSIDELVEMPIDKAQEPSVDLAMPEAILEAIPKGAHTGNVVHDLLENSAFSDLAQGHDINVARDQACLRYGLTLEQPSLIDSLLNRVVLTPLSSLDPEFYLANLSVQQCLKELPFFYAFNAINSAEINSILAQSPDYKVLTGREMQGFLTGFIDLICHYQGKYYVMDYKTNTLVNYHQDSMAASMREHNYGLQYWIYSLVLHQYLRQRLPGYNYQQHFGGVRYLFVRGMDPSRSASGVYTVLPDLATLEKLMAFFSNE